MKKHYILLFVAMSCLLIAPLSAKTISFDDGCTHMTADDFPLENHAKTTLTELPNAYPVKVLETAKIHTVTLTPKSHRVFKMMETDPPHAGCQDVTIDLNAGGNGILIATDVNNGSSDGGSGINPNAFSVAPNTFECASIASNPSEVTLTVEDNDANQSTCKASVTVRDLINPTALCKDLTVTLNGSGSGSIGHSDANNGSNDACGLSSMSTTLTTFDCDDVAISPLNVTLIVTDNHGNQSSCTSDVSVIDDTDPNAICQDVTLTLDPNGTKTLFANDVNNGSNDNCAPIGGSLSLAIYDCSHIATNPNVVTLIVNDVANNLSTCTANVTVVDDTDPTAICQDVTVCLDGTGLGFLAASDVNDGSTDACGIQSPTVNPFIFGCGNIGDNTVTLTVTDNNSNQSTCTAYASVADKMAPTALCKDVTVNLNGGSVATVAVSDVDNNSSDNCGITGYSVSPNTFGCSGGITTLSLSDATGNQSSCTASVTIDDKVFPAAKCDDITIDLDGNGMASIAPSDVDANSSDNCGIASMSASPSMFDCNDAGTTTTVTLGVVDGSGNPDACTASVFVNQNTPHADCKDITISLEDNGMASIAGSDVNDGSSDACGISGMDVSPNTFNCNDVGLNPVTLTVTNSNGGQASCTATVRVENEPVTRCIDITVQLNGNGEASIEPADVDDGSSDACGITGRSVIPNTFECTNAPSTTVTLTVFNINGGYGQRASASCTATVTLEDNIPPTINCPTKALKRNTDPGVCTHTVVGTDLDPLPIDDNCQVASITNDYNNSSSLGGAVLPKGKTTVTWTVYDASGNSTTCTYDIRIRDREAPVFDNCPQAASYVVPFCSTGMVHTWPTLTATDNCTKANKIAINVFPLSGSFFPLGTTTVNATATDKAGNVGDCIFTVTVTEDCDPLPAGVTHGDIGNTGNVVGKVCYDAPTKLYEIKTSGSGIANAVGSMDGFHYICLNSSDMMVDVRARIVQQPTNNYRDRVGVMIRQDNAPNSASISTLIAGDNKTIMVNRAATGMFATGVHGPTLPGPLWPGPVYWVRLHKIGPIYYSYVSPDGVAWTPISATPQSNSISGSYKVGIAATVGTPGQVIHYKVDNFTVNGTAYKLGEDANSPLSVSAFPNPVHNQLNVNIIAPSASQVQMTLRNAIGQELIVQRFEADAEGIMVRNIEMSDLAAGVYLLEVRTDKESKTIKVRKF